MSGAAAVTTTLLLSRLEPSRVFPPRRDGTMRKRVAFGTERAAELNPLLSLVEDWMRAPGGYVEHMHKGFESVTLVFAGEVATLDANGPREVLRAGDVQWLHTGHGVMHAELPEGEVETHSLQLWLNLPAGQKQGLPRCQTHRGDAVPQVDKPGARVRVIAGAFDGKLGAAQAACGARVLDVRLEAGARLDLPLPAGQLGALYVVDGALTAGAHAAHAGDVVHFTTKLSERLPLVASTVCQLVVVHAVPLQEPVIVNGPFIMNSAAQIAEAYAEFRAGTFAPPATPGVSAVAV